MAELRSQLHSVPEFEDFFFMHEYRGFKCITPHAGSVGNEVLRAYNEFTEDLDQDAIHEEDWWVDIGIELSVPEKILQWTEAGHRLLVKHLLPHLTEQKINAFMKSSGWATDTSALLYELAGFRSKTGSYGTEAQVLYLNVYTTDKEPTYQLHKGQFREHRYLELLPDSINTLIKDIEGLTYTYAHCREEQEGSARVEIRVSLSAAFERMRIFPKSLAEDTIVAIDSRLWWCVHADPMRQDK